MTWAEYAGFIAEIKKIKKFLSDSLQGRDKLRYLGVGWKIMGLLK
jgi:hypothetical protein